MHSIHIVIVNKKNLLIIQDNIVNLHSVKLADNSDQEFFAIPIEEFYKDVIQDTFNDNDNDDDRISIDPDNLQPILVGIDVDYVIASTDYFSGAGEQCALLVKADKVTYSESINVSLFHLGVTKGQFDDEFDTINLGKYRSNEDFYTEKPKETIQVFEDTITLTRNELLILISNVELNLDLGEKIKEFINEKLYKK